MASALAAGNVVLLKLNELCGLSALAMNRSRSECWFAAEHTSALMARLIPQYLSSQCVRVVTGSVPQATAVLKQRFDLIFYTGNTVASLLTCECC